MSRSITLLAVLLFGVLIVAPVSAQGPRGKGHGPGFGGGRGAGAGQGRGLRQHAIRNEQAANPRQVTHPVITNHGGVFPLPDAAQQPRQGSKILVDLTGGGDANKLNAGLEKIARYVNIYAGGGARPTKAQIAVIFHGDATLSVLNADAYAAKFRTDGNPNLQLLEELHESGVELYVCGQSLISKGSSPEEVAAFIETAVSALTASVNLQADGYAYVPIANSAPAASPEPQAVASKIENPLDQENHDHGATPGRGMGRGMGRRMGLGPAGMQEMQGDMTTLHAMFSDREKIQRTVALLPDGAEAVTESDDAAIANMLKEHVPAMEGRVLGNKPLPPMTFHPIFVELIKHADDYSLTYEETEKGMKVRYQSDDPYVVMLVQEHAKLVSRFIKNGMEEIHTPYSLPNAPKSPDRDGR